MDRILGDDGEARREATLAASLRRVALGARLVGIGWLTILGAITLARVASAAVGTVLGVSVAWGLLSAATARTRPSSIVAAPALVVDVGVAVAALVVASEVGSSFYGGFPLLVVAIAAVRSTRAAWWTAAALTAVVASQVGLAGVVGSVSQMFTYVGGAFVLTWALGVLRAAEERRVAAEESVARAEEQRVRAEERAEISRHLHDSVLQTLALVQRNADRSLEVVTLARRQERELRDWLFGTATPEAGTFAEALRGSAGEVEADYGIPIEVVVVGDAPASEALTGLLGAAREAMVNAAKHSGASSISVYGEAGDGGVRAYIHDRGSGFDPAAVAGDRRGIRSSIVGRIEELGGRATCRSSSGGTEWSLEITP